MLFQRRKLDPARTINGRGLQATRPVGNLVFWLIFLLVGGLSVWGAVALGLRRQHIIERQTAEDDARAMAQTEAAAAAPPSPTPPPQVAAPAPSSPGPTSLPASIMKAPSDQAAAPASAGPNPL
ncbi:hypothetical protein [Phenylobacterium aquaticum]|uniref:hypothetical protein n=1 Tax=Phenylobacterium aquaticum TaxID=1763816 RepID=UPI0026F30EB4|nr:hypothetical protein [Phenylobacterium aquaticum]